MSTRPLEEAQKRGHEQVAFFNYPQAGLKAIVAIHSTVLGPALGGCRLRIYSSEDEAIEDVMRLAEGMTYKNAIAGLDLGGGKSCIVGDPKMIKGRRELFLQFGHCLNHLAGRYITAEDMGTSVADIMIVREVSPHIAGISTELGGGGDPSPWTARGVHRGIIAACERSFGTPDLSKRTFTVQGVGHVGMYLVERLVRAGAKVTVCDADSSTALEAVRRFDVAVVKPDAIYDLPCDVYAPCAIGQTVNPQTLRRLKCKIIAGAANNQLSDATVYGMIQERKIVYCPDFVINAGGVINVGAEYVPGGWRENWVVEKVDRIYSTVQMILERAESSGEFTERVALALARERIAAHSQKKQQ